MLDGFEKALDRIFAPKDAPRSKPLDVSPKKRVLDKTIHYTKHHRGNWFRPEYDFKEIQVAQGVDTFLGKAIRKKVDRFMLAGYEWVCKTDEPLQYIKRRLGEMEIATNTPFDIVLERTVHDLTRFNNCMWAKVRGSELSSGKVRTDISGVLLEPVAGYFVMPFETLELKHTVGGEIKKVRQKLEDGERREWKPVDIIHFYTNRLPGFSVGTPELWAALDDIALLRRIEDNVEELIETNLFPVFHYTVGTDQFPERFAPDGSKETDFVKKTVEYMPAGGIYVSDHRHKIEAVGSESKALRIEAYLEYFKKRVFAAIGVSPIDMGDGGDSNRSTASTLSKGLMMDVEFLQHTMKIFLDFYVVNELLLEGGFDPLDPEQKVSIRFGIIDKGERLAFENNQIQLFANKVLTHTEVRKALGYAPMTDEDEEDTYYKKYEEPLALLKSMVPGSAAGETLAASPTSAVTPEAINKEKTFAKQQAAAAAKAKSTGRPSNSASTGSRRSSASKARPSNQSGTRPGPKLTRDVNLTYGDCTIIIKVDSKIDSRDILQWTETVLSQYKELQSYGISLNTLANTLLPKLNTSRGSDE